MYIYKKKTTARNQTYKEIISLQNRFVAENLYGKGKDTELC